MSRVWAGWIGKIRQLESAIQTRIEGTARAGDPAAARQPIEIVHAIVHLVQQEVQSTGRGRVQFPYTQVRIGIAAATARDRARLSAACEGPPSLRDRIVDRLTGTGCDAADLQVKVAFLAEPKPDWIDPAFHVDYARAAPPSAVPSSPSRLELAVVAGTADRSSYTFTGGHISLGRGTEVRDRHDRLVRTNQVAFVEGAGDINASVSRRHARIEHDTASDTFRLHDDGASHGTSVIREGRGLAVPQGRGLRLRSGDVIALGLARVRVQVRSRTQA
jgi:hypothetical protein